MEISAKELLESCDMMLSRCLAIRAKIESAQVRSKLHTEDVIEEMALGGPTRWVAKIQQHRR